MLHAAADATHLLFQSVGERQKPRLLAAHHGDLITQEAYLPAGVAAYLLESVADVVHLGRARQPEDKDQQNDGGSQFEAAQAGE